MKEHRLRKRPTSKRLIAKVAKAYVEEIKSEFPGVDTYITEGIDGFDVWIQIEDPEELSELQDAVRDKTVELNWRFLEEAGVLPVATVGLRITGRYAAYMG